MERCLDRLKYQFYTRKHLQSLIPNQPFAFCICTGNETWKIIFSKNEFLFDRTNLDENTNAKIIAEKNIALLLLNGEIRLSHLKKHNEIVYEGSFRHFLLLESVLWLCRDYGEDIEAVSY